jgi:hypothetical protein
LGKVVASTTRATEEEAISFCVDILEDLVERKDGVKVANNKYAKATDQSISAIQMSHSIKESWSVTSSVRVPWTFSIIRSWMAIMA